MTVSETDMEDELLQKLNNKHGMIEDDYEQPQCKDEKDQMGRNKICYVRLKGVRNGRGRVSDRNKE